MATSVTILGPFAQADFNTSSGKTTIQNAITTAIGGNTCVSADPQVILGNIYIFVTTS